jgi:hypothetical protein
MTIRTLRLTVLRLLDKARKWLAPAGAGRFAQVRYTAVPMTLAGLPTLRPIGSTGIGRPAR